MTPHLILKQYFGYDEFRPGQLEIVESIVSGKNTLALMPTGGGKSLCFQVPGLCLNGTTLVISPLISLMKDQVDTLNKKNISATYLNSSLSSEELKLRLTKAANNEYKFIYLAPERLQSASFKKVCQNLNISLIAIDEAHCISQWGHDFRPEYVQISDFVKTLSSRPIIAAFTATAPKRIVNDIISSLQLTEPQIFSRSFRRDNLYLESKICNNQTQRQFFLIYLLKKYQSQSGVIYALTRNAVEEIAELITFFLPNYSVGFYHGGLDSEQRSQIQEQFLKNQIQVIVATNAFGMGVDKSNVRFVIHYQAPGNLENYYQEAGRGGRDGQPADCYFLYSVDDLKISQDFINQTNPDSNHPQHKLNMSRLQSVHTYAVAKTCHLNVILNYFNESSIQPCQNCDNCLGFKLQPTQPEKLFYSQLKQYCWHLAKLHHQPSAMVATSDMLHWLTLLRPQSIEEFLRLPGVGRGWIKLWYQPLKKFMVSNEKYFNEHIELDHC